MKILMIAPEPIFEPRGTPLSVVGRLKALSALEHEVDLLTYPIGMDVDIPNIRIHRTAQVPGIRRIKIGPSFAKLPLDFLLMVKTFIFLCKNKYDLIHTHEEAGFWGTAFSIFFRIPHLYDMHSSLPQQLMNFQFSNSRLLFGLFNGLEKWVLKKAAAVITICPDLRDHVAAQFPEKGSVLIENVIDYGMIFGEKDRSEAIRKQYELDGRKVILYAGTFEPYQGLDLLIQSARHFYNHSDLIFLMVGGHPNQVKMYQEMAEKNDLDDIFIFTGQVMPQEVNSYIRCSDILVSPRSSGTNTPLKLYSYLRSGKPIVATNLLTNTQVLNPDVAVLTPPTAEAFAMGLESILTDRAYGQRIVEQAKALADEKYSYSVYLEKLSHVLKLAAGGK